MATNNANFTKASFQADIKRKQAFFNRCMRRFKVANTVGEKNFLKNEAKRICTELKTCQKKWTSCKFGAAAWICKGFNMTSFNAAAKKNTRTTARKSSTTSASRKGSARRSTRRTSTAGRRTTRSSVSRRTRATTGSKSRRTSTRGRSSARRAVAC